MTSNALRADNPSTSLDRIRVALSGAVQGVGFRPFVHRLARELQLTGFVTNDTRGVIIEVQGAPERTELFVERLLSDKPPHATPRIERLAHRPPELEAVFEIRASEHGEGIRAVLLPDLGTCQDCLRELLDPLDGRYAYPFTNCTNCGPRFSIIRELPYDRPRTTMAGFSMCAACSREYTDIEDRRFHAQPNACPHCGPSLELRTADGRQHAVREEALERAATALEQGAIVATKGLGGFHLMVNAADSAAVQLLRERKSRWQKPFALMVPDVEAARTLCQLSATEAAWLEAAQAPILLLPRRSAAAISDIVAPEHNELGIMLPYTPLHHLLMRRLRMPMVATSGNLSEEPICIDNEEALMRLGGIADWFLLHDRPIERQVDDSVAVVVGDELQLLRRSRGFAPAPLRATKELPCVLALGGHLKNTVALGIGHEIFVSQHVGDLSNRQARDAQQRIVADFLEMYDAHPQAIACDLHPDIPELGTLFAPDSPLGRRLSQARVIQVQHHHAHLAACLLDNNCAEPVLGVTWDGTGYGLDGSIWGGEFLLGDASGFERVAHLRDFRLPGSEAAVREPRRCAAGLLAELGKEELLQEHLDEHFSSTESKAVRQMLRGGFNSPLTTSAGRLFDAAASLLGLRQVNGYEAQAAIELERTADATDSDAYPLALSAHEHGLVLDWGPTVIALLQEHRRSVPLARIVSRFHNALAEAVVRVARHCDSSRVALSGGCFQNRYLLNACRQRLRAAGIDVLYHRQIPTNDGGLSAGQIAVAAHQLLRPQESKGSETCA